MGDTDYITKAEFEAAIAGMMEQHERWGDGLSRQFRELKEHVEALEKAQCLHMLSNWRRLNLDANEDKR